MKRELVAFIGREGSGKSFQSNSLVQGRGFTKVSFADPLRDIAFATIGLDFNTGMLNYDNLKKTELFNGLNFRNILENLGAAVRQYERNFWADALINVIDSTDNNIVIDDMRYPNEYFTVEKYCKNNNVDFRVYFCNYISENYREDNMHQSAALSNYLCNLGYQDLQAIDREDIVGYDCSTLSNITKELLDMRK